MGFVSGEREENRLLNRNESERERESEKADIKLPRFQGKLGEKQVSKNKQTKPCKWTSPLRKRKQEKATQNKSFPAKKT